MRVIKAIEYKITATKKEFDTYKVSDSTSAVSFARNLYKDDILVYESVYILLINRANRITGYAKISCGGTSQSIVDIKIIAKYAIETLSSAVILVHNHPSGNLVPSPEDEKLTKTLNEALKLFGIKLYDSIILSDDGYLSMSDEGRL